MNKITKVFAFLMVLTMVATMLPLLAFADEPVAVAVYGTPDQVDGVLDNGWKNANTYECKVGGTVTDIALTWKIMYDDTNIYVYADVTDSTIGTAAQEETGQWDYWTRNTLQSFFDLGYERTVDAYDKNDFYIDVNARGYFAFHKIRGTDFVDYAVVVTDTGYTVEYALDFGLHSDFEAVEGACFGFDIWACDGGVEEKVRMDQMMWVGHSDAFRRADVLGTVRLGAKPAETDGYNGLIQGTNLKDLGASFTAITNAEGKDVSVIVDGVKTDYGFENVDTWQATYTDDLGVWFGVDFGAEYDVKQVLFWEGGHWNDGGWFGSSPKLQCYVNGEWVDADCEISPAYPGDNRDAQGLPYEHYFFTLEETVTCSKIRVVGANNSLAGHASCSEIEVFGYGANQTPETEEPVTPPATQEPVTPPATEKPAPTGDSMIGLAAMAVISAAAVMVFGKKRTMR